MTLRNVIDHLQNVVLYNKSNLKQLEETNIVKLINGSLTHIHSIFNVRYEQAIIVIPEYRQTFILDDKDTHVVMSTYNKMALAEFMVDKTNVKNQLDALFKVKDILLEKKLELLNADVEGTIAERLVNEARDDVLQVVRVEDSRNRRYVLNQQGAFMLSPEQIYLPNCNIDDLVYVVYKPKPKECSLDKLDEHIDLPDTLLRLMYAHIAWVLTTNIVGYDGNKYPSLYQTYEKELISAQTTMAVAPDNMEATLDIPKGFY